MSFERRNNWTRQGTPLCPLERRRRHGPIRPMQEPGWLSRIAQRLTGRANHE